MANFISRLFSSAAAPPVRRQDTTTSVALCPTGISVGNGGWGNSVSGLGVEGYDPTASTHYRSGRIPSAYLVDRLYTFDWLAARVIEKMPSIAMVRGFTLPGPAGADGTPDQLLKDFRALNVTERFPKGAFERAVYDGRAYGGSVLLLGYTLGNPASELTEKQRAGGINFFDVFGQHELRVLTRYDDPKLGNFGMPELYEVIAASSGPPHPRHGQIFHASRSIRFTGNPLRVPNTTTDLIGDYPEIGISVLTPILTELGRYGLAWSAVSNMLQDASIGVMKMQGLVEALASEDKAIVEDRLSMMQQTRGAHRMFFLDADANEEYTRTEVKLTDIPQILQQFMIGVSGAAEVPAAIFFSSSPAGLNANAKGEGDMTQLYNTCKNYQDQYLGPKLETILTAVNGGRTVTIKWPSLWEASINEAAQTRLAEANADKVWWDMGFSGEQIAKARANGTYIELLGAKPEDDRDEVAAAGQPPPGETDPQGAPGKKGASKIATAQRAAEK